MTAVFENLNTEVTKWLSKSNFVRSNTLVAYTPEMWQNDLTQAKLQELWDDVKPTGRLVIVAAAPGTINWRDETYKIIDEKVSVLKHVDVYVHFVLPFQVNATVTVIDRR